MKDTQENLIRDEMSQKIIDTAEGLATLNGAHTINVRCILKELGITNRVFYNRFHNIDEVLQIVYKNTVLKIRENFDTQIDENEDFFEYVMRMLEEILVRSYDIKMKFNHYIFEHDSLSENNFNWWNDKIKKLILYAKEKDYIIDVDVDALSYSIWCFCRGFNADAVGRNLPKEEAVRRFKYSFGFLLNGIKNN